MQIGCDCHRCTEELCAASPLGAEDKLFGVIDPRMNRIFLRATCGNKRCPHAADDRKVCTGSNEVGQPGSLYIAKLEQLS